MSLAVFDQAIALSGEPGELKNTISPDYQNVVGPFGGITAATLLHAIISHPEVKGTPVAVTVNYLGPIKGDELLIRPRLIRTNRTNQHWMIEAYSDDQCVLTATAVFASRVDSWASTEIAMPEVASFEKLQPMNTELLSAWTRQYDMRFIRGNPLTEAEASDEPSESLHWISDRQERKVDFAALCAICDSFFPRFFVHTRQIVPFGTVSFTAYFHVVQEELDELDSPWVLGHARASKFHGSYSDQTGEIWGTNGKLLATTSQVCYYKY